MNAAILTCLVLAGMTAWSAKAEIRTSLGYADLAGDNRSGGEGWDNIDDGGGYTFALGYYADRWFVAGSYDSLDLDVRNRYFCFTCPPIAPPYIYYFDYTDEFRAYRIKFGWRHAWNERVGMWVALGWAHERWSNNGGFTRNTYPPTADLAFPISSFSTEISSPLSEAGVDFTLWRRASLAAGISYQRDTYIAIVPTLAASGARPDTGSLTEGIARLTQGFGSHFHGFLEYRPSSQRQFLMLGVEARF